MVRSLKAVGVLATDGSAMPGAVVGTVLPETSAEKRRAAIRVLFAIQCAIDDLSWTRPRTGLGTKDKNGKCVRKKADPHQTLHLIWGGGRPGVSNRGGGHLRASGSEFPSQLSTARPGAWEIHTSPLLVHPLAPRPPRHAHGLSQGVLSHTHAHHYVSNSPRGGQSVPATSPPSLGPPAPAETHRTTSPRSWRSKPPGPPAGSSRASSG